MTRQLTMIHLLGNALLLWLAYYWLGVGESRTATLIWSVSVLVALVCFTCLLHGATWVCFAGADLKSALRSTLRNLLPILVVVCAALALYLLLEQWAAYSEQPAFRIGSWLTLKVRKPVKPASVLWVFNAVLWIVEWVIIPVFLLPVAASAAIRGWRGLRPRAPQARYWILCPVLLLLALWVPQRLIGWTPYHGAFGLEMASFILRIMVAYVLFTAMWLWLARITATKNSPVHMSA